MCIRDRCLIKIGGQTLLHRYLTLLSSVGVRQADIVVGYKQEMIRAAVESDSCLLYTSDAADERSSVDLGGRRIIKKKKRGETGGVRSIE